MIDFIHTLRARYASMLQHRPMDAEQAREAAQKLNALRLAEAVLKKITLNEQHPEHTQHIGILGPTQSGKSTLVNLLFRSEVAGVSALAGYTVHAQGFLTDAQCEPSHQSGALFDDFDRVTLDTLQHENYKQYSIEAIAPVNTDGLNNADPDKQSLPSAVVWDSPDFDSIESGSYRSAVLRVAAIADVCILMVSKDKYADKSVWDMLSLLQPLHKPLIVCINKLNDPDTEIVISSFQERYKTNICPERLPAIVPLPYIKGLDKRATQIAQAQRHKLIEHIHNNLQASNRDQQKAGAYRFIQQHWEAWLAPVVAERQAQTHWQKAVDAAMSSAMQRYRSGYLDHPQKYDTFNRALAELLSLLEIPGLAGTLGTTRKIVTWPVRKLLQLGKTVVDQTPAATYVATELEDEVLQQAAQHAMNRLSDEILNAEQENEALTHWWASLSRTLNQRQSAMLRDFENQRESYQQAFKPKIDEAAHKLYANLQKQPTVLNSLRAARVSTDAAAVVLAVHSGGLAASDLVLAPAMLSLTTLLTESALGRYMDGVRSDLKALQAQEVEQQLFRDVLQSQLYELAEDMGGNNGLLSISQNQLDIAQTQLNELRTEVDEH